MANQSLGISACGMSGWTHCWPLEHPATQPQTEAALNFLLADHLGSTTAVIGSGGTFTVKYWPFGGIRSGALASDRGFTGQYKEGALTSTMDAYFYNARFYSPKTAHFLSADTLVPEVSQRGLNRFAYTVNNPVRYSDPSGNCFTFYGETLPCARQNNDTHDAVTWLHCAMTCGDSLIGALARYGISTPEFWVNVLSTAPADPLLIGQMLTSMARAVHDDVSSLAEIPTEAWTVFGAVFQTSWSFFAASFYGAVTGEMDLLWALGTSDTIGAHAWWKDSAVLGREFAGLVIPPCVRSFGTRMGSRTSFTTRHWVLPRHSASTL